MESDAGKNESVKKDGIIAFIMDKNDKWNKLIVLDVRKSLPMISVGRDPVLINLDGSREILGRFDHLSIPPSFRLHMTSPKERIYFNVRELEDVLQTEKNIPPVHFFSHVGPCFNCTKPLVAPGKGKVWNGAALISPMVDKQFSGNTRFCVEFFIHTNEVDSRLILNRPFTVPEFNMRLAFTRDGPLFGPFRIGGLVRNGDVVRKDLSYTIRMSYVEERDYPESTYTYAPFAILERKIKIQ